MAHIDEYRPPPGGLPCGQDRADISRASADAKRPRDSDADQSTADPVRRQLIEARRAQILGAAATVFAEKGFHRATTKEIAQTAGIAEGTIYNYFGSKGDLLIGLVMRLSSVETLGVELVDALDRDAREFLISVARHRMALIEQNHEMLRAVLPEIMVYPDLRERFYRQFAHPMASALEQYVRARAASGEMSRVDVPLVVRAVQGMFLGLLVLRVLGDDVLQARWDDVPEVIGALIFDGLRPQGGE
jgi:AcrR family transcriptional regulator